MHDIHDNARYCSRRTTIAIAVLAIEISEALSPTSISVIVIRYRHCSTDIAISNFAASGTISVGFIEKTRRSRAYGLPEYAIDNANFVTRQLSAILVQFIYMHLTSRGVKIFISMENILIELI